MADKTKAEIDADAEKAAAEQRRAEQERDQQRAAGEQQARQGQGSGTNVQQTTDGPKVGELGGIARPPAGGDGEGAREARALSPNDRETFANASGSALGTGAEATRVTSGVQGERFPTREGAEQPEGAETAEQLQARHAKEIDDVVKGYHETIRGMIDRGLQGAEAEAARLRQELSRRIVDMTANHRREADAHSFAQGGAGIEALPVEQEWRDAHPQEAALRDRNAGRLPGAQRIGDETIGRDLAADNQRAAGGPNSGPR